uniref:Uncharacterized protein n=1 Tax=Candidatus Kentrum sp. LPFa TaxID=2126335 RepID=A0A450X815_9GAMM|nr:MAG: hypothetical protein BECKLPF1236A_GA0070988_100029 [Candidatus Kentron sp. LPFa]VFK25416.1 MAG: hypothetical protein BECKLPF1236C_GA0070990_1002116 [Candidatus Kentron sp. LPFa]
MNITSIIKNVLFWLGWLMSVAALFIFNVAMLASSKAVGIEEQSFSFWEYTAVTLSVVIMLFAAYGYVSKKYKGVSISIVIAVCFGLLIFPYLPALLMK